MKKQLIVLFFITLLIPSIAMASWWNPLSWRIFDRMFYRTESVQAVPTAETINNEDIANQPQQNELKETNKTTENEKIQKEPEVSKNENVSLPKENVVVTDPTDCKISSFTVNGSSSATIAMNRGVVLLWETTDCISITLSGISRDGGFPLSGNVQLYHPQTRDYILTAIDSNGSKVTKSVSVIVSSIILPEEEEIIPSPVIPCSSMGGPSLDVTSPDGGEVYTQGQEVEISWSSCHIPDTGLIMIAYGYSGPGSHEPVNILSFVSNVHHATITLPTLPNPIPALKEGRYYKIYIAYINAEDSTIITSDWSGSLFTINQ